MHFQVLDNFHEDEMLPLPFTLCAWAADSGLEAVAFLIEAVEEFAPLAAQNVS